MIAQRIRVNGSVQGVGFRPTVWRLARDEGIVGEVWNDSGGVVIHAWGAADALGRFKERLLAEPPRLARIDEVTVTPADTLQPPPSDFSIVGSQTGEARTDVAADAATCPECLAEILKPYNRRYRYPFTNCTHCGPRLSIIGQIPYDRANTSMAPFVMCPACQAEYDDPADRRFHAQPNACPECGPQLWLEDAAGERIALQNGEDTIAATAKLIRQGKIVAIKGIGGFHLACDAGNSEAVDTLRQRKQRYHKPFALMARDAGMVRRYAVADEREVQQLESTAAPIVVLKQAGEGLPAALAPGQNSLGFMLPYTPLHHLLLRELERPIVLTSGNRSHEPQVTDNDEAREQLGEIADCFLLHDRDIVSRLDDSVVRLADGQPRLLRRARGFAPQPIALHRVFAGGKNILAMGAELKSTFCLFKQGRAILAQHLGDLEEARTHESYRENLQRYRQLFDFTPEVIAIDAHPDYLSSQLGQAIAAEGNVPLITVQHHHAHIAAVMAEHGLPLGCGKVVGVALDGLGYGENGELWGGEFLLADYLGYERLTHFAAVPLPGGRQAMHEPWRNTFAHLAAALGWEQVEKAYPGLELVRFLNGKPLANLQTMITRGLNSPTASSAGRLFDAVAAALGVCREHAGYEGQAAIELEALARDHFASQRDYAYDFAREGTAIGWAPLWSSLLEDLQARLEPGVIAARFHHALALVVAETASGLCASHGVDTVVLGGGVMQNRLLLECSSELLRRQGLRVLSAAALPANDGGLALGQAAIAAALSRVG